jgi:hypothetical protein
VGPRIRLGCHGCELRAGMARTVPALLWGQSKRVGVAPACTEIRRLVTGYGLPARGEPRGWCPGLGSSTLASAEVFLSCRACWV